MPWEQPASQPASMSAPMIDPPVLAPPVAQAPPVVQAAPPPVAAAQPESPFNFGASSAEPAFAPSFDQPFSRSASTAPATTPTPARSAAGLLGSVVSWVLGFAVGFFVSRAMVPKAPQATGLEAIKDFGQRSGAKAWPSPKADVPTSQKLSLGATVQVGNLAVTPLKVERRKVVKVHYQNSENKETSAEESLVLRVKFRNTSSNLSFTPLDEMFLRENSDSPAYSYIQLEGDTTVSMFELSAFSEFNIEGQPFDELVPGQEYEALIAAAEGSAEQAKGKGKMLWRFLVRTGVGPDKSYTTVLAVEFTGDQVQAG
jgi:hypothetical protein